MQAEQRCHLAGPGRMVGAWARVAAVKEVRRAGFWMAFTEILLHLATFLDHPARGHERTSGARPGLDGADPRQPKLTLPPQVACAAAQAETQPTESLPLTGGWGTAEPQGCEVLTPGFGMRAYLETELLQIHLLTVKLRSHWSRWAPTSNMTRVLTSREETQGWTQGEGSSVGHGTPRTATTSRSREAAGRTLPCGFQRIQPCGHPDLGFPTHLWR